MKLKLFTHFIIVSLVSASLLSSCSQEEKEVVRPATVGESDEKFARKYQVVINEIRVRKLPQFQPDGTTWDFGTTTENRPDPYFWLNNAFSTFPIAGWGYIKMDNESNTDTWDRRYNPIQNYDGKPVVWSSSLNLPGKGMTYSYDTKALKLVFTFRDMDEFSPSADDPIMGTVEWDANQTFKLRNKPETLSLTNSDKSIEIELKLSWRKFS